MKDNYSSPPQRDFYYIQLEPFASFSEKQVYQIIDKLKEVGKNYFEDIERKWGTTLF